MKQHSRERGFTLIEILIGLVIVAILVSIALPSYTRYIKRSRVPPGLDALSSYGVRMEQAYQDSGRYDTGGACTPTLPTVANFIVTCSILNGGQGYLLVASGTGSIAGFSYSYDNTGARRTLSHPYGVPATACWSIKGGECDDQ